MKSLTWPMKSRDENFFYSTFSLFLCCMIIHSFILFIESKFLVKIVRRLIQTENTKLKCSKIFRKITKTSIWKRNKKIVQGKNINDNNGNFNILHFIHTINQIYFT